MTDTNPHFAISPIDYIHQNDIGFIAGYVIMLLARFDHPLGKGADDLQEAINNLGILIDQIGQGHQSYVHYFDRHSLTITPESFCHANGFEGHQASIITLVTHYNLCGNGVGDLRYAQQLAQQLLNEFL